MLLDDVFDKLDENRVKNLMRIIAQAPFGQVLITDTGKNRVTALLQECGLSCTELEMNVKIPADETAL